MSDHKIQARIAGLIYAGGRGVRMGGVDKALMVRGGVSQIERMTGAMTPFVEEVLITRQRDQADVSEFGQVIYDDEADQGPLAGLVRGLKAAAGYDFLLTAAVDGNGLPDDYLLRLMHARQPHAMARSGKDIHPTFALIDLSYGSEIVAIYAQGERRLRAWATSANCGWADFPEGSFQNSNSPRD